MTNKFLMNFRKRSLGKTFCCTKLYQSTFWCLRRVIKLRPRPFIIQAFVGNKLGTVFTFKDSQTKSIIHKNFMHF
ncbi:hypothetical protein T10_2944 [Trichinella papuae]|uniref:Uncharacterized protein n=1 Tax=Trichinella papuae TaxID=268474 RepID=A0A0V1M7L1_9BILA|nr:hypothetical protein T10_2944 [Trichinella papuae]